MDYDTAAAIALDAIAERGMRDHDALVESLTERILESYDDSRADGESHAEAIESARALVML